MVVEVRVKQKSYNSTEIVSKRYGLKTPLKILCFIKNREIHELKANGAIIKKALSMNDKAYAHIATLGKDGMIVRDKKKFIELTKQGEDTIKKSFFTIIPSYETDGLLKNFVRYLSAETKDFLLLRRSEGTFFPDSFLISLNEELLELYEEKFKKFCRNVEAVGNEVN